MSASGQTETSTRRCGMSVLAPEADFVRLPGQVRSVPEAEISRRQDGAELKTSQMT
jgi:hypothetical protein